MENGDIPSVVKLEQTCFEEPWSSQSLESYVNNKDAVFLVSESNGEIAGYAGMYYVYPEGYITNVAVFEKFRNQGIATQILKKIFEISEKEGVDRCSLEVRVSNQTAIHVYEKMGFQGVGERKNFYDNPTENALIMWKEYRSE